MHNPNDRRQFSNILREPLTRQRFWLNGKLRTANDPEQPKPFTLDELKLFIDALPVRSPAFHVEKAKALTAAEKGEIVGAPVFDTPEAQLLWGGVLAFLTVNPAQKAAWTTPVPAETPLPDTPLWKAIVDTRAVQKELLSHAHHIRSALHDRSTRYSWSAPGAGFAFDRTHNHIHIDLMQSMIVGFEHARADVYREIGHSLLSVTYPKRMQQIYRDMAPLMKKARLAQDKKGPELKPDEYKELRLLSAEWQLRHMMFAAAEENVANRFVANVGKQMLQDYGVSLNNTAVTHRAIGLVRLPQGDDASDDLKRYMNLCNTVQLSFFQNNKLFDNTDRGWQEVGIDPRLIRTVKTRKSGKDDPSVGIDHPDFERLRDLCGGPKGLENLQPKLSERLYGFDALTSRILRLDLERKLVIETIWNEYAEDLIQNILKQTNDEIDQQMEQAKQKKDQDQDGQDQQDGQDGEGQEQDGEGSGQSSGKGKPQKGQKPQKQRGKPQGKPQDMDDDGQEGDEEDQDQSGQDGQDQDQNGEEQEKDQDGQGKKQDGDEQGQDKKKSGTPEGELGADEDETVPVEGMGDMPAPETPSEVPADEVDPSADGQDADGEDQDGIDGEADGDENDGQTVEEMEEDLQEGQEGEGQDEDGEDADVKAEGKGKKKRPGGRKASSGKKRKMEDLATQDWTKYNERIAELSEPITRVRKLFKAVQERQLQRKRTMSNTLDILPENGEVKDRFNAEAHKNMIIKKATGQLELNDFKRFHQDQEKLIPTTIDIVIAIDGSGSMNGPILNAALQAAAIMYEAAAGKDMNMNVYVMMWGDKAPPVLIRPGDDRVKVGQEMERARKGLNSGTDLAPAIKRTAETMSEQHARANTMSGFTHVLVISDGEIADATSAYKSIKTMFEASDKVTIDTAVITGRSETAMERMAKSIKSRKEQQTVGVVLERDPEVLPMAIVGMLLDKIRKCGSFMAVPNAQKRRSMKRAHQKLKDKGL